MAVFRARIAQEPDGSWVASAVSLPNCWSRASSREEALAKLRAEIRYRVEYCPCSGVDDDFVELEVSNGAAGRRREVAELRGVAGCPPPIAPRGPGSASSFQPPGWKRWDD